MGSTKLLHMLSEITETPISHANFSLKIMYKIPKKGIFVRETIYCYTKTETNFLHTYKKKLCHKNKFPSQKQLSSDFLSEKHTSVYEKS